MKKEFKKNEYFSDTTIKDENPVTEQCINDQHSLENYNRWLRARYSIQQKLGKKLQRETGDLLMNFSDGLNKIKEEKAALEYTRIPQVFDKYRGNPAWFENPPGLHDHCSCMCKSETVTYSYQKTKMQKNEIPEIERIGISRPIASELMLIPKTRNIYKNWLKQEYRKTRVEELSLLLENIIPHNPQFENLIVVGNKSTLLENQILSTVSISKHQSIIQQEHAVSSTYDFSLNLCLKINGTFLFKSSPSLYTSRKFHILFNYDIQNNPLDIKYITFENVGRITIRIYWKEMKKFKLFHEYIRKSSSDFFCFDKNMLILVPGQILNFPIWFKTDKVCSVEETWEITTLPQFWPDHIRVFFVLQAQAYIKRFMKNIKEIKANIEKRVKMRIIKELLEDATEKTKYNSYKSIDYSYYESELFEAMNLDSKNIEQKPKYLYDKAVVGKLKELYLEVRQTFHPQTWNLKLSDLRILVRIKDVIDYAANRTNEYRAYRNVVLKSKITDPTPQGSKLKVRPDSKQGIPKPANYSSMMNLIWKLTSPSMIINTERFKYFQIFSIFSAYFTLMSLELSTIKAFERPRNYNEPKKTQNFCERLIFERFDDTDQLHTKRSVYGDMRAQPKPEYMKDINPDDIQKMYRLYFKKETASEKGKGKSDTSKSTANHSKTTIVRDAMIVENFDPFEEIQRKMSKKNVIPPHLVKEDSTDHLKSHSHGSIMDLECSTGPIQELNLYTVVYSNLAKAIDTMVDTLESAKEIRVPYKDLEKLKGCFELFLDEETVEKEQASINPFTDKEDREYFEKVLSAHMNDITGDYLICSNMKSIERHKEEGRDLSMWSSKDFACREHQQVWQREQRYSESDTNVTRKSVSIFSLPKITPYEVQYVEKDVQASLGGDEVTLPRLTVSTDSCQCPLEFREVPVYTDEFYYSDEDNLCGFKGVTKKGPSKPKQDVTSLGSTDSSYMSLLKEWTKKKGVGKLFAKDMTD